MCVDAPQQERKREKISFFFFNFIRARIDTLELHFIYTYISRVVVPFSRIANVGRSGSRGQQSAVCVCVCVSCVCVRVQKGESCET